jgi:hypothetical protein
LTSSNSQYSIVNSQLLKFAFLKESGFGPAITTLPKLVVCFGVPYISKKNP